jgi:hypothetical protein
MNYPAASSGVSDFSVKNLSFDRKWFVSGVYYHISSSLRFFNRPKAPPRKRALGY